MSIASLPRPATPPFKRAVRYPCPPSMAAGRPKLPSLHIHPDVEHDPDVVQLLVPDLPFLLEGLVEPRHNTNGGMDRNCREGDAPQSRGQTSVGHLGCALGGDTSPDLHTARSLRARARAPPAQATLTHQSVASRRARALTEDNATKGEPSYPQFRHLGGHMSECRQTITPFRRGSQVFTQGSLAAQRAWREKGRAMERKSEAWPTSVRIPRFPKSSDDEGSA